MNLISILEAGRDDFLDATHDISEEQAIAKPTPDRWSVLECIEHVVTVENRNLDWISNGAKIKPAADRENETRLFTIMRSRFTKVETPEILRPQGRFSNLADASAAFTAARDRSIQTVRQHGDALYAIGVHHPHFGDLNAPELISLIDGHSRRHAEQIRETCDAIAGARR